MGDNQDDTPRYSKVQVQEMLRDHEKQTLASMSPNIDEIVAASIAKHLETISLKPSTSPSVDSGASKSFTIPPRTSGKDGEFYNNVGHGYFTPTQMPHYNNLGNSPMYDGTHFSFWKSSMESHLRSYSEGLWEVVVQGYKPLDPNDLSPRDKYNRQLNASAWDKIRKGIHRELHDQVKNIESAKNLWERIIILQEGTSLIQKSNYKDAKRDMDYFVIQDGETLSQAYARLEALKVRIEGLGCDKYNDGFVMNDEFMKDNIITLIALDNQQLALRMQFLDRNKDMTPDDLISYFVANENMAIQGMKMKEMAHEMKGNDLALKATEVPRYEEEDDDSNQGEMVDMGDLAQDLILFAKKYGIGSIRRGRFSSNKSRVKGIQDCAIIAMKQDTLPDCVPTRRERIG
jgi:hypothetical protein